MKHLFTKLNQHGSSRDCQFIAGPSSVHHRLRTLKHVAFLLLFLLGSLNVWGDTATFSLWSYSGGQITGGTLSGAPTGATATLTTTYTNASQLTSGNSHTLTLSGFDGCTITGLKCHMKANASKGKGTITITINGDSKGTLSINRPGDTYQDQTVPVTSTVVNSGTNVVVTIAATENSLYCDSYTITYTASSGGPTKPTV